MDPGWLAGWLAGWLRRPTAWSSSSRSGRFFSARSDLPVEWFS